MNDIVFALIGLFALLAFFWFDLARINGPKKTRVHATGDERQAQPEVRIMIVDSAMVKHMLEGGQQNRSLPGMEERWYERGK